MIKLMLIAGAGGFAGTCARFLLGRFAAFQFPGTFPAGTLLVNLLGCFLFGLFAGLLERSNIVGSVPAVLLLTGFCGGFTTFSAFSADILGVIERGQWLSFGIYTAASVILGVALVWLGRLGGRMF